MNSAINFLINLYRGRRTIHALAGRQVLSRYAGTLFRGAWEVAYRAMAILVETGREEKERMLVKEKFTRASGLLSVVVSIASGFALCPMNRDG